MALRLNVRKFNIFILFVALLFLMCLDDLVNISLLQLFFKHIDELLTIVLTIYVILNYRNLLKRKSTLILIWMLFMCVGWLSTLVNRYQPIFPALVDAFLLVNRFIIGYFTVVIYINKSKGNISQILVKCARFVSVILFAVALHDLFFTPFFPKSDYRFFTYGLQLMFPHATYLAAAEVTLLILLGYKNHENSNLIYMLMSTFVGVMTLRGKAIAFFGVYWMIYLLIVVFKFRHYFLTMLAGALLSIIIGWEQIMDTFNNTAYRPRTILLKDGIKLMLSHFPLGTGFATYGSSIAANYYSPLYVKLSYPENLGMSPDNTMFLTDGFWPTIFAEFGFFGLVLFVCVICYFLRLTLQKMNQNRYSGVAMLATLIYMLISSTAESSFFNPVSLLLFMLFAIYEKEA